MSKITKLGFGIVAFEGTEHIKNITYEIRELVDEIIVCLQSVSYHNEPIDPKDVEEIDKLIAAGYVDKVIWFTPDLSYLDKKLSPEELGKAPRLIETDKRNYMLDFLEKEGCSHSMIIDSDEFYDKREFKLCRDAIDSNEEYKITYCRYINYWRDYRHYLMWPFPTFVPFIFESQYRFSFGAKCFDGAIDPTRIVNIPAGVLYHKFDWKSIRMHHLSWIRLDITKKIDAWSAKKYFDNNKNFKLEHIYNRYNNWKTYQNAKIMFTVPYHDVCVGELPAQYISPHYLLNEEVEQYVKNSDSNISSEQ